MNKKLFYYILAGIFFVSVLGTLSHFFFEWSGNNSIVGLFSPVNESTWEHLKLLFFPMLIYALFMRSKLNMAYPCGFSALLVGIIIGCSLIPILFYTYTGVLGRNITVIDIAIFYLSVIAAFYISYRLTLNCKAKPYETQLRTAVFIIAVLFLLFTYIPPGIALFVSP